MICVQFNTNRVSLTVSRKNIFGFIDTILLAFIDTILLAILLGGVPGVSPEGCLSDAPRGDAFLQAARLLRPRDDEAVVGL